MTTRIRKHARRLARLAARAARKGKKALQRLWRYHQHLLATEPGYSPLLRLAGTFLLDLAALPRVVAAALRAALDHVTTTQQTYPALPY